MDRLDLRYICTQIGNLSGIPVRIYRDGESVFFHTTTCLPVDPALLYREQLLAVDGSVGYVSTEDFHYFGVVRTPEATIAVGPTRQIPSSEQELRDLAFRADVPREKIDAFLSGMRSIVRMPLESILQMLCVVNYVLNGEKLELRDLTIREPDQRQLRQQTESRRSEAEAPAPHNTLALEEILLDLVRRGDVQSLRSWLAAAPAVRGGTLAAEQLRQRKNMLIVTATLCSRAAIQGGLDSDEALSLSDQFIQRAELMRTPGEIAGLQYHMLVEYTERVDQVRQGKHPTRLSLAVANYVRHHLSEPITAENIAAALYMSRPYLSTRFRQETGQTLTDFVLREKTEEAQRLLRYSDKSVSAIGDYLGFSSLGHFSRTFKRYTGQSPKEYRGGKAGVQ